MKKVWTIKSVFRPAKPMQSKLLDDYMAKPERAPDSVPTPVWIWVAAAVLFAWIVVASLCQPAKCHEPTPFDPPPGTVLVSRNLDPRLNGNWGE